jgi:hypothetical protein
LNDSRFLTRSCTKHNRMFILYHLLCPTFLSRVVRAKLGRSLKQPFFLWLKHSRFIKETSFRVLYNLPLASFFFLSLSLLFVSLSFRPISFCLVITCYFTVFFAVPSLYRRCLKLRNCLQETSRHSTPGMRWSKIREDKIKTLKRLMSENVGIHVILLFWYTQMKEILVMNASNTREFDYYTGVK